MGSLASLVFLLLCAIALPAQNTPKVPVTDQEGEELPPFYCPMDLDVRSYAGGKCYKCSMQMVLGIPEPVEYRLKLSVRPTQIRPGEPVELQFEVLEPGQDQRVRGFQIVHEKIFHLLFVHHELEIFRHEHPVLGEDGIFRHKTEFPKAGIYRMLADFYPEGSTPQLIPVTLTTAGFEQSLVAAKPLLLPDLEAKQGDNLTITLTLDPPETDRGTENVVVLRPRHSPGFGEVPGSLGAHAGRQRRSRRHDSCPPDDRRRRPPDSTEYDFSEARHVPHLDSDAARGQGQHDTVYRAGEGTAMSREALTPWAG